MTEDKKVHKVYWDEEAKQIIEEVPEGEMPDCMVKKHHWRHFDTFSACIVCGLAHYHTNNNKKEEEK